MLDVEQARLQLDESWWTALEAEFSQPYMQKLQSFLEREAGEGKGIFPPPEKIFYAFAATPLERVRVVILGQDPYPTPGDAHGLSFSVENPQKRLPKSLANIFKELKDDVGVENTTGNLSSWAQQGVLLLNAVLTVESGNAGSHQKRGWETFTDTVIDVLNQREHPIVFVLWGAYAQKKGARINEQRHRVIRSAHPSPLAAYRGFWGSKPFSGVNQQLLAWGDRPIDWELEKET
ncbi:MAG: uracil-DNA glycosylase [bacterium]